jgi:anaerobic ribonucleoside-triphosphate reductase
MDILSTINGFSFELEFNESNLNKFNITKKIKPLVNEFNKFEDCDKIKKDITDKIKKDITDKIKQKIKSELDDEIDLINIYKSKLNKIKNEDLSDDKIKQIIETPLEGEFSKHNKVKVITVKLIRTDTDEIDAIFYVKYIQLENYNKQFQNIINNFKIY